MAEQNDKKGSVEYTDDCAYIHVISDSLGDTAAAVLATAAAQFEPGTVRVMRLPCVEEVQQVTEYLDENEDANHPSAVFHTIVDTDLRNELRRELESRQIYSIDIIGPAINVLATLTESEPKPKRVPKSEWV